LGEEGHTAVDGLELALCFTFVLDTNGAASAGRVGGHYGVLMLWCETGLKVGGGCCGMDVQEKKQWNLLWNSTAADH
jgi:hypothetical protein